MSRISSKNQITLPAKSLTAAGLTAGDEVVVEADGPDVLVVRRVTGDPTQAIGIFDGLFEPDYLEKLRAGERA